MGLDKPNKPRRTEQVSGTLSNAPQTSRQFEAHYKTTRHAVEQYRRHSIPHNFQCSRGTGGTLYSVPIGAWYTVYWLITFQSLLDSMALCDTAATVNTAFSKQIIATSSLACATQYWAKEPSFARMGFPAMRHSASLEVSVVLASVYSP